MRLWRKRTPPTTRRKICCSIPHSRKTYGREGKSYQDLGLNVFWLESCDEMPSILDKVGGRITEGDFGIVRYRAVNL